MSRHITSSIRRAPAQRSLLKPLNPSRNLTDEVVERVAREIRSGRLAAGARLPTELELMSALGVSRTVVREAVAALRAEGLVVTRQGSGAYVSHEAHRAAFRIGSAAKNTRSSLADVVSIIELRLAVEVEAAALAAERATPQDLRRIDAALAAIGKAIAAGDTAIAEDFAFHRAIAVATGNPHYASFLDFLGPHFIPRQKLRAAQSPRSDHLAYLAALQKDHARIADAIRARNVSDSRKAMRAHLSKSVERYRRLAADKTI